MNELEDATIGMAKEMLEMDDSAAILEVKSELVAEGWSEADVNLLFDTTTTRTKLLVTDQPFIGDLADKVRLMVRVTHEMPPHVIVVNGTEEAVEAVSNLPEMKGNPVLTFAEVMFIEAWNMDKLPHDKDGQTWGSMGEGP